jgi:uncharacterized protein
VRRSLLAWFSGLCWAAWACLALPVHAQDLLPVPAASARVVDQAGALSPAQQASLEAQLAAFEAERGTQIAVLLVPSTAPEDIASFAQRVGDVWKLGRPGVGDGLLIVVAKDDRKVWIATAKALEGAVPDLAARAIVKDILSPAFRRGDFAGGLQAGVEALMQRIRAEGLPAAAPASEPAGGSWTSAGWWEQAAIFLFVVVPMISMVLTSVFGRRLGSVLTAGASGGLGWLFTGSVLLGVLAGLVALLVVGVLGVGAVLQRVAARCRKEAPPVDRADAGARPARWSGAGAQAGLGVVGVGVLTAAVSVASVPEAVAILVAVAPEGIGDEPMAAPGEAPLVG